MDQGGLHGEGDDGEELDLGLLLLPCLYGVEEPHGIEETHSSVSSLRLLPLHLQQSGEGRYKRYSELLMT